MLEIDNAIFTKWTGDSGAGGVNTLAGGRVFRADSAPQNATYPRATYRQVSNVPVYTLPFLNHRRVVYQLEGVSLGTDSAPAQAIAARAEALANDTQGNALYSALSIAGWTVIYSRSIGDIPPFAEKDGDQRYQHVGFEVMMILAPSS